MILLLISSNSERKLEQIAQLLLSKKLAVDVTIGSDQEQLIVAQNGLERKKDFLLRAKTKALLFSKINKTIRELYSDDLPRIFSIPIVNMDWEQAEDLGLQLGESK